MPGYVAELDRLSAAVEIAKNNPQFVQEIIMHLPAQWIVRVENRTYRIDSEWLRSSMKKLTGNKADDAPRLLRARIAALKADAQAFQQPSPDVSSSRRALAGILARREFRKVHGPTWLDALKKKLILLLLRIIERIFGSSAFPTVSRILVWMLVAVAVMMLAAWIFNTMRRNARLETIALESPPVSAKEWTVWMAEAHAAAANSAWREAIHLSYWAGISFLESRGLWKPDRARTPREYLRLLASSGEYVSSLSALTRQFESIWYGGSAAGPDSFSEALNCLESLGCHSN